MECLIAITVVAAFGWFLYTRITDKPINPFKGGGWGSGKDKH